METQAPNASARQGGIAAEGGETLLSVVIVSYNVSGYLDHCLDSAFKACEGLPHEIIVVDNASTDGTDEMVRRKYPSAQFIGNARNAGYSRANNQGFARARGRFVLLLNPDTIVPAGAFRTALDFLASRPDAGLVSLKIVNADGSFQPACRRSFPTPATAFYRMTGLSMLFPKSRVFGRYNLTYLDENDTAEVDAVCGAFMMIRREALEKAGGLDEQFFMFGEDIDFCYRIRRAGYKVYYYPACQIIHFKGKSSRKNRFRSAWNFYSSMLIFSRKYFGQKLGFLPKSLLFLGIFLNALFKVLLVWVTRLVPALFDAVLINGTLYCALMLKPGTGGDFYRLTEFKWALLLHGSMTLIFLSVFGLSGLYSGKSRTFTAYAKAVLLASLLFFSFVYFIPDIRFSRIAFTATCLCLFFLLPLWRRLFALVTSGLSSGLIRNRRTIILGTGPMARRIFEKLFRGNGASRGFVGFVRLSAEPCAVEPASQVLGETEDLGRLVEEKRITEIILATPDKSRLDTIGLIQFCTKKGIALRMVQGMLEEDKYFILDIALSESTVI